MVEALGVAEKIFGLAGLAEARQVNNQWVQIVPAAEAAVSDALAVRTDPKASFKIETRRIEKRFPKRSIEINRELGDHLSRRFTSLRVDVRNPDLTLHVEVRFKGTYLYVNPRGGAGGLPVGSSGRAVALLSGGIDSPVAAWFAMKRGLFLEGLHFDTPGFTHPHSVEKVKEISRLLSGWGGPQKLHIVNFTPLQQWLWASAPPAMRITLMRRMFVRIAERAAREVGAGALVTGESLGQVASQTLDSMGVIQRACTIPILRPLVGFDKLEIIQRAKEIGTYETSILPYEDCCALFVAQHPETRPVLETIERVEASMSFQDEIERAWNARETLAIGGPGNSRKAWASNLSL